MALLFLGAGHVRASTVDSFSGVLNGTDPGSGTVSDFTFGGGAEISTPDPTSLLSMDDFVISTVDPLDLNVTHFDAGTTLGSTMPELTLTNGSDTIDFTLSQVEITNYPIPVLGGLEYFYYGIVQAEVPIGGVAVEGPDATELLAELLDFTQNGGGLFLTYNGIDIVSGSATIGPSPSASLTVVAGAVPSAPEPSSAILTLSGAVAIGLRKLARHLRRKNPSVFDESPD